MVTDIVPQPSKGDLDGTPTAPTNTHSAQFLLLENSGNIQYTKLLCRLSEILYSTKHSAWHTDWIWQIRAEEGLTMEKTKMSKYRYQAWQNLQED